jgi:hypothetical protein
MEDEGFRRWSDVDMAGSPDPVQQFSPVQNAAEVGLGGEPDAHGILAFVPASAIQESRMMDELEDSPRPTVHFSSMEIPASSPGNETIEEYDSDALPVAGSWSGHSQNSLCKIVRSSSPTEGKSAMNIAVKALPIRQPSPPCHRDPPSPTFGRSGLPRVVLLSPPPNLIPVYGTLFEREDPWNTIGRILSGDEDAEWESDDDFEAEQGYEPQDEIVQAGRTSSPNWSCSLRTLFCTEANDGNASKDDGDFEALVDEEWDTEISSIDIANATNALSTILSSRTSSVLQTDGVALELLEYSPKVKPEGRSSPRVRASPIHDRDGDGDESESGLDMLSVPELEAVDGKFVGPSLFDFADEDSEEE